MLIVHQTHSCTVESQSGEPTLFLPFVLLEEDKLQHKITLLRDLSSCGLAASKDANVTTPLVCPGA